MRKGQQKPKIPLAQISFGVAANENKAVDLIDRKPAGWLLYSKADRENGKRLFKDAGFNLALTDKGKVVPYTALADSEAERDRYLEENFDATCFAVREIRIVRKMHGEWVNEGKWKEWGFNVSGVPHHLLNAHTGSQATKDRWRKPNPPTRSHHNS